MVAWLFAQSQPNAPCARERPSLTKMPFIFSRESICRAVLPSLKLQRERISSLGNLLFLEYLPVSTPIPKAVRLMLAKLFFSHMARVSRFPSKIFRHCWMAQQFLLCAKKAARSGESVLQP